VIDPRANSLEKLVPPAPLPHASRGALKRIQSQAVVGGFKALASAASRPWRRRSAQAHLHEPSMPSTEWSNTMKSVPSPQVKSASSRIDVSGLNMSGARISGVSLRGILMRNTNLAGADMSDSCLRGANMVGADLTGAELLGADLCRVGLQSANLHTANLSHANLRGADLRSANLTCADLSGADLGYAVLRGANLRGTNLRGANLAGADLTGANLSDPASLLGVNGNCREIRSIQVDKWPVAYTETHLQIGCQLHPIAEWWAFDDEEIDIMEEQALQWWRQWKPILRQIIEASPACVESEVADEH